MTEYRSAFCVTSLDPVELKDGIVELLKDKQAQDTLVKNAVAMVEKYHNKQEIQNRLVHNLFWNCGKDAHQY